MKPNLLEAGHHVLCRGRQKEPSTFTQLSRLHLRNYAEGIEDLDDVGQKQAEIRVTMAWEKFAAHH